MSNGSSKIHMKVGEIEISIEGSPDFVIRQYREMEKELNLRNKMTEALSETTVQSEPSTVSEKSTKTTRNKKAASRPVEKAPSKGQMDEFGEWLRVLPKGLKNRDKALVAAYYNQQNSKDNVFRVRDLNNTLKNNDIRITNPSSLIKNLSQSHNIIRQVSRKGRQVYYQFTKEGEGYIKDLLSVNKK